MSILDSIHDAEQQAEKIVADAKLKARDIISQAEAQARASSEKDVETARADYRARLASIEKAAQEKSRDYLQAKETENDKRAKAAEVNIPKAADFIMNKVIGQC